MATWVQQIQISGTPLSGAIAYVTLNGVTISATYTDSKTDLIDSLVTQATTAFSVPASRSGYTLLLTLDVADQATVNYIEGYPNTTLDKTSNYLYALCGKYALMAKSLISNTGGIVINPVTGLPINLVRKEVSFTVGAANSPMVDGDTVYILNDVPIRGWVEVYADGVKLPMDEAVRFSYTLIYNSTNTIVTFNSGVSTDQIIDIIYWVSEVETSSSSASGTYIVTQYTYTAIADEVTDTGAIAALVNATVISIVKEIATLEASQYSHNSVTGNIALLGGLQLYTGERLFITYSITI